MTRFLPVTLAVALLLAVPRAMDAQVIQPPTDSTCCGAGSAAGEGAFVEASTIVLTREDLERIGAITLPEILQGYVSGAYSLDMGSRNDIDRLIRIRGPNGLSICPAVPRSRNFSSDQCPGPVGSTVCSTCSPRILIDGVEMTAVALGSVNIESLQRIEITPGPVAALRYGTNAANGVIHLITRKSPPASGYAGGVSGSIGSLDSPYRADVPLSHGYRGWFGDDVSAFSYSIGISHRRDGGHVPLYDREATDLSFGLTGELGNLEVSGFARWGTMRAANPGWAAYYYELYADGILPSWGERIDDDDRSIYRSAAAGLGFRYEHSDRWTSSLTFGDHYLDLDFRSVPTLQPGDSMTILTTERYSFPNGRISTRFSSPVSDSFRLTLEAGADRRSQRRLGYDSFHRQTGEPRVIHSQGDIIEERAVSGGVFADARIGWEAFSLAIGARAGSHTDFPDEEWRVTPRVALGHTLRIGEDWSARTHLSWATAHSTPAPFMISGLAPDIRANPELEPQTTRGWDGGVEVRGLDGRVTAAASFYDQRTTDVVGPLATLPDGTSQFVNSPGTIRNRGQSLDVRLNGGLLSGRAVVWRNSNSVRGVAGEVDGQPVADEVTPELLALLESQVALDRWLPRPASVGLRVNHLGRRWANDRRAIIEQLADPPEGYRDHRWFEPVTRLDAFATLSIHPRFTLRGDLWNLTNDLTPEVPEVVVPGRQLRLTVTSRF